MALKGFINTLEAVIASAMVLGVILTTINFIDVDSSNLGENELKSDLANLEEMNDLGGNVSQIEDNIIDHIPPETSFGVSTTSVKKQDFELSLEEDFTKELDRKAEQGRLKAWIHQNNGIKISHGNEILFEDETFEGYTQINLGSRNGTLSVEGEGNLDIRIQEYKKSSNNETGEGETRITSYLTPYNGSIREVRIHKWRE